MTDPQTAFDAILPGWFRPAFPLASMLQVMAALLGPSMAIYAANLLLRRNRDDGRDLSDETGTGPFWCTPGVN